MNCPECQSVSVECKNRCVRQRRAAPGQKIRCVVVHWECKRCGCRYEQVIAAAVGGRGYMVV